MEKSLVGLSILGFMLFAIFSNGYGAETVVLCPNINGLGEKSFGYQVLSFVLKKTGKPYIVKMDPSEMNQSRAIQELDKGALSVIDLGYGAEFESKFEVVNIPIDMGLTGWRIFIINKNQKEAFAKIKTLKELKRKVAGQGIAWTDVQIIENSGIKVVTSSKIENLINMVDGERFDFFPLGVNEAHGFLEQYGKGMENLIIEDTIVLVYPFGRFYYVKKGDKQLAADITEGLEKAYADGSFKKFIEEIPFFKEGLKKSNLNSRKVIKINNPFLTKNFRKIEQKWWYKP